VSSVKHCEMSLGGNLINVVYYVDGKPRAQTSLNSLYDQNFCTVLSSKFAQHIGIQNSPKVKLGTVYRPTVTFIERFSFTFHRFTVTLQKVCTLEVDNFSHLIIEQIVIITVIDDTVAHTYCLCHWLQYSYFVYSLDSSTDAGAQTPQCPQLNIQLQLTCTDLSPIHMYFSQHHISDCNFIFRILY